MRIGAKKRILYKWQFFFEIGWCIPELHHCFRPYIVFYFAKVLHVPPEGEMMKECCYKGINFYWDILKNVVIIMRKRRIGNFYIHYPIKVYFQK